MTTSLDSPVRVLFFIGDLTLGGTEVHLARLLSLLDRARVEPEVMVLNARGPLLQTVLGLGIPVHDIENRGTALDLARSCLRVRDIVRRVRPSVLHAYGYPCDVLSSLARMGRSSPVLLTSRRGNQPRARRRFLLRLTNPWVDRVVCVSNATAAFAVRTELLSPAKIEIIPNGIDLSSFPTEPRVRRTVHQIGTLGRLRQVKGSDLLLEAFERLENPDLVLRIAGAADSSWGEDLRRRYMGNSRVEFIDFVDDSVGFLERLDLFVLPSRSEGMSNALLEAMAAGLPIVATDVGSNGEVLGGGDAGLIVSPSADAIAAGIRRLIGDPELAGRLARAARRRAKQHYALAGMAQRYETLYVGMGRGPRPS